MRRQALSGRNSPKNSRIRRPEEEDSRPWYQYSASPPLSVTHPELAREWHASKNGILTSGDYTYGSQEKVWWQCTRNRRHAWPARIGDRTISRSGCPYCSGKRASNANNLKALFPGIAEEWHRKKNRKLTPDEVLPKSNRKVWWQCSRERDHEWRSSISSRTANGTGCPHCSGNKVSRTNSLATLFPQLAKEWHPTQNGKLTPADVTYGSNQVVWWKCKKGKDHVWSANVRRRTRTGKGCPFCHGLRASTTNSLVSLCPEIAAEWHNTKNRGLNREAIVARSQRRVWWKCAADAKHDWQARVQDRTQKLSGCPYCAGRGGRIPKPSPKSHLNAGATVRKRRIHAEDDMREPMPTQVSSEEIDRYETTQFPGPADVCAWAAGCPRVAQSWHPALNATAVPDGTLAMHEVVWWRCLRDENHVWMATIYERTKRQLGCPFCPRQIDVQPERSLACRFPEIAREWHPKLNGNLTPELVGAASDRIIWWQCNRVRKHVFRLRIDKRTLRGRGCPYCSKRKRRPTPATAIS